MPKCPVCVAMYLALFTGIGFSVTSASDLRTGVIILCIFALLCLTVKSLFRLARQRAGGSQQRLTELLDKQDTGTTLTDAERHEAEGLVDLAELLSLLRLRSERKGSRSVLFDPRRDAWRLHFRWDGEFCPQPFQGYCAP